MKSKNHPNTVTTVVALPLPVSLILATDLFCSACLTRTKSSRGAKFILENEGLCKTCLLKKQLEHMKDEVAGYLIDYLNEMGDE